TKNKDFTSGTRGEGEEKLVEEHKKRKEQYTKLIEDTFDKTIENKKKIEQEKEKKKREEKDKLEKILSHPEIKEKTIHPETPQNINDKETKPLSLEEKTALYKQKYLERKRKNEERQLDLNQNNDG